MHGLFDEKSTATIIDWETRLDLADKAERRGEDQKTNKRKTRMRLNENKRKKKLKSCRHLGARKG
jgi:hypothetical protein